MEDERSPLDVEPEPARLLDEDPGLVDAVPDEDVEAARAAARAPVILATHGRWQPPPPPTSAPFVGLLLLDGVLAHEISLGGTGCTELLGRGDLLRPRPHSASGSSLACDVSFYVDEPARIAILDGSFMRASARWPSLMSEMVARCTRRSQALATQLAITFLTGSDVRVHALLWHLADRWGRVAPDGVVLPLQLSHERLARLVRGRRPAISQGLKLLANRGAVERRADGTWLLRGGPPEELSRARESPDRPL
ncbi:MAG TPA: hypothetical protein VGR12_02555 [Solirubrobacteraceae bacterium]|nr:hypothetical protein [Solirubrobacteraceae bacterium]